MKSVKITHVITFSITHSLSLSLSLSNTHTHTHTHTHASTHTHTKARIHTHTQDVRVLRHTHSWIRANVSAFTPTQSHPRNPIITVRILHYESSRHWPSFLACRLTPICPDILLTLYTQKQKCLPGLANGALIQRTRGKNTQPSLLRKGKSLFRGPCQQNAKTTVG